MHRSSGDIQPRMPGTHREASRGPGPGDAISSECNEMPQSFIRDPGTGWTQMMTKKSDDARAEGEARSERATLDKETTVSLLSSGSSRKKPPQTGDPKNSTARRKR